MNLEEFKKIYPIKWKAYGTDWRILPVLYCCDKKRIGLTKDELVKLTEETDERKFSEKITTALRLNQIGFKESSDKKRYFLTPEMVKVFEELYL